MKRIGIPLLLLVVAVAMFAVGSALADQKVHEGTFVKQSANQEFVMERNGAEHRHTLSPDAKVIDANGKECLLTDLVQGQKIRVTTIEGDDTVAIRLEVLKE